MERVKTKLDEYVQDIKKGIVKKMVIYSLDKSEEGQMLYLKYSVLSSWFAKVNSYDDFKERYDTFIDLTNDKDVIDLFNLVKKISVEKDKKNDNFDTDYNFNIDPDQEKVNIEVAKKLYNKKIISEDYNQKINKSGYRLPEDYEDNNKYLDYSLHKNVMFVGLLRTHLIKVDKYLQTKKNELMREYGLYTIDEERKRGKK